MKRTASERLIGSIQIEAFAHATEDPDKVKHAISFLIPDTELDLRIENLRGHFDNPILLLQIKIEDAKRIEQTIDRLQNGLEPEQKEKLALELNQHLDDRGWLYLRLDKQQSYQGRFILSGGDDVVKVTLALAPHITRRHQPEEVYRLCGLIV